MWTTCAGSVYCSWWPHRSPRRSLSRMRFLLHTEDAKVTVDFQYPIFLSFCGRKRTVTNLKFRLKLHSKLSQCSQLRSSPSSLHWYERSRQLSSHLACSSENLSCTFLRLKSSLKRVSLLTMEEFGLSVAAGTTLVNIMINRNLTLQLPTGGLRSWSALLQAAGRPRRRGVPGGERNILRLPSCSTVETSTLWGCRVTLDYSRRISTFTSLLVVWSLRILTLVNCDAHSSNAAL